MATSRAASAPAAGGGLGRDHAPLGSRLIAIGALLGAMVSFQVGVSVAKGMFAEIGAPGAAALRLFFGAPLLAAAFRPWRARPTGAGWWSIAAYGTALGAMNLLFYLAVARVPLGLAVAMEFTGPLGVAMLASRRPIDFLWIGLCAAGLALILSPAPAATTALDPIGVACAFGAGACWALYIVFGQKAGGEHGMKTTALGMLIAAAFVIPIGVATTGAAIVSPSVLTTGALLGVLGTALPYSLEMVALTRLPARTYGILSSLSPAAAALAGLALLGQQLTGLQWLAICAVVAASIGATATMRPGAAAAAVEPL